MLQFLTTLLGTSLKFEFPLLLFRECERAIACSETTDIFSKDQYKPMAELRLEPRAPGGKSVMLPIQISNLLMSGGNLQSEA